MTMLQLTSERLVYEKIVPSEIALFREITQNEAVMRYITGKKHTADEADERFKRIMETNAGYPETGYLWARQKEDGAMVGYVKLVYLNHEQLEVGYALMPEFWGRKFASEMLECLVRYNRETLKANVLVGYVDLENPASIQVLTKQNFVPERTEFRNGRKVARYVLTMSE